ncbi:MAG: hypothetical protein LIO79_01810 [Rikenellaceae bacterium]|nr:hypothetical protein [Rikenellaceae bacterium]
MFGSWRIDKYILGWLLMGLLLTPLMVRTIHIEIHSDLCYFYHSDASNDAEDGHDYDNCPLCQFHLAAFIDPVTIKFSYIPQLTDLYPDTHIHSDYHSSPLSILSRGPPSL